MTTDTTPTIDTTTDTTAPRRGRKPITIEPIEPLPASSAVDVALETAVAEIREGTVSIREEEFIKMIALAEDLGKIKMAETLRAGLELKLVQWFAVMKETGDYKNAPIARPDGSMFFPKTFDELCTGMGFSKQKIYEDLQNLAQFGEECLSKTRHMGLKTRDMRKLRAALKDAGEDEKAEIFIALEESAPEDMQTTLDVICARNAKLKEDNERLKKDMDAKNKLAVERNKKLDDLSTELLKATSTAPDDVAARIATKNINAQKQLDAACNEALGTILKVCNTARAVFADEEIESETMTTIHKRVSLLCSCAASAILEAGIDVDLKTEFEPEWMREAAEGDHAAAPETTTVM